MFKNVRPYNLLGIMGLLLFAISFLIPFQSVDIHLRDTYYVFDISYAVRNMAGFLLALFTACSFLNQKLYSAVLNWIHAVLTILTVAVGILLLYKASNAYRPGFSDWSTFQTINTIIVITIIVFVIAQALLIVNLLIGLFKSRKR